MDLTRTATRRIAPAIALCLAVAGCGGAATPSSGPTPTLAVTPSPVPGPTDTPATVEPDGSPSPTPEPVYLHSSGVASLTLTNVSSFVPSGPDGTLTCDSGPDVTTVDLATALDLGELDGTTVRGQFHPFGGPGNPGSLELFVDGGDLAEGSFQPFWHGSGAFVTHDDGLTGQVGFGSLVLETDPKLPAPDPRWPLTLAGTLTWSCLPWPAIDPAPGGSPILPTVPPPSATTGG